MIIFRPYLRLELLWLPHRSLMGRHRYWAVWTFRTQRKGVCKPMGGGFCDFPGVSGSWAGGMAEGLGQASAGNLGLCSQVLGERPPQVGVWSGGLSH